MYNPFKVNLDNTRLGGKLFSIFVASYFFSSRYLTVLVKLTINKSCMFFSVKPFDNKDGH